MVDTNTKDTTSTSADANKKDTKDTTKTTNTDKTTTENSESSLPNDLKTTFSKVFSVSNIILVVWFIAAYLLTYVVINMTRSSDTGTSFVLRIVDAAILISIVVFILFYYYDGPADKRDDKLTNVRNTTYSILSDPNTLIYTAIFLVCYSAIVYIFRIPTSGVDALMSLWFVSNIAGLLFIISAIVVFCKYVLGISILDSSLFDTIQNTTPTTNEKSTSDTKPADEVFNIANNLYTYDDAQVICASFGSRLATYDEIEKAYEKGGEWCNYGWSEGQMAFFPTQKKTWDKLQKNPHTKNNCGRPGINGGYIENPYIQFGVNCFGKKPKPSKKELQAMADNKDIVYPKTKEDELINKKVEYWKENADKLLNVNSFNRNKWSEY
jgi:hypothetical protein